MTVAELISRLQEQPDYLEVVFGEHEFPVEGVQRIQAKHGNAIVLDIAQPHQIDGIIGNPPGELRQETAEKLKEYGLSIEGIAAEPRQRRKYIDLERSIPDLIEQLSDWVGLKNARLLWEGRAGYSGDEAEVEHTIAWEGLDDPNEIAGRLIRKYETEQREREQYKELHAKYGPKEAEHNGTSSAG